MAKQNDGPQRTRLVELSEDAAADLAGIQIYTALQHGWAQAQAYDNLIAIEAQAAADEPARGRKVKGVPDACAVLVKWPKAKHGHYIVYRIAPTGIYISRIQHDAMHIPDRLGEAKRK